MIDVRSAQKVQETNDNSALTFPSLVYKAFVQLVIKHKLSDTAANDIIKLFKKFHIDLTATLPLNAKSARTLLDSIQIPHILYNKTVVMKYNETEYVLHHRSIFHAVKELLSNIEIFKHCIFDYKPIYTTNNQGEEERCYSELYNGEW